MKVASPYRSLRALARDLGVPERRLASEAARFPEAVPATDVGGHRRYGPRAAAALGLIVRLRAAGRDDEAVAAELARGPVALVAPSPLPPVSAATLATALNRRRERRQRTVLAMREALEGLAGAAERHRRRVESVRAALEAHGSDLSALRYYDGLMARFRAELRMAERAMADVFRAAAAGGPASGGS